MIAVSYGAGTNSTAMLVEMVKRGIRPDVITFADTGGERPTTYEYCSMFSDWLVSKNFPQIEIVRKVRRNGDVITLEQDLLEQGNLPSIAYGFKTCSQKYKIEPQDKFMNSNEIAKNTWENGGKVTKYIGYDADEERRAKDYEDKKYDFKYPLIEWGMGRDECVQSIIDAGLTLPGKSACFFCPSSKPKEIRQLKHKFPDLLKRAIAMEENAFENLTSVKGLGRNWSWKDMIEFEDRQIDFFRCDMDVPCGCYDG